MAAQVEVQAGEVGRPGVGGRLHLSPLTDSSNKSLIDIPSIIPSEPNKPAPGPKPRLSPKPFSVDRNPTIKPILAPKPQPKPKPESTRLSGQKPEPPNSPKPQQPAAPGKPSPVSATSNRPTSIIFKLSTGQTTKPVVHPFKPAPPLIAGDPSKPVPALRQRPPESSLAYIKSFKKVSSAEWSGSTKTDNKDQTTSSRGGPSISRAKSMGSLDLLGQEEEEKKSEPAVQRRPQPRASRPRPVSAIFLDSSAKTEAPVPAPRWPARRPLSADLTSKFESIGLSLHHKPTKENTKENTPEEKPQKKETENTPKSVTPQSPSVEASAAVSDQSNKKTEERSAREPKDNKGTVSVKKRISLLLDSSSSPASTASGQVSEGHTPVQPAPETEPAVGVKQLIKQLTVDTTPTQSPVLRLPLKPRPRPLDLTKRFTSEMSSDSGSVETPDRHDISKDPQTRTGEEVTPSDQKAFVDFKDSQEQLKKSSMEEGMEADDVFVSTTKDSSAVGDFQKVRASLFENVVEWRSVMVIDEAKSVNKDKDSPRSPFLRRESSDEGTLVTATYREPASPSSPLRVRHSFDAVQAVDESRVLSESLPPALREDKAMTLRMRRSEGGKTLEERNTEPVGSLVILEQQPRYLRIGALPKWSVTGLEQDASKGQQAEGQVAFNADREKQREVEQEEVAAAPKRLKMLPADDQPKPKATYFALTGQIQEPVSPSMDTNSPFDDLAVRSAIGGSQRKVLPMKRNPSLDEAFGKKSFDHHAEEAFMKSRISHEESRSGLEEVMEVERKRELKKEAERHKAKMKELEREKQRQLALEKEEQLEFERLKEREKQREFERQRQKAYEKEKQELEEKQCALERQKQLELENQKFQELEREKQERERQRQLEKEKRRELERQRKHEEKERQREQERQRQKEEERQRELDRERQLLEMQKEKLKMEELERIKEQERQFQKQKQKERERLQIIEMEKHRLREKMEREQAEKIKQMALEQEMLRIREIEKEKERQREMEKEMEREKEREKQRELERQRQKELDRERQRQLDMERQELENQRQRQLEMERQELENQRQRQRELEKERQRKEEIERAEFERKKLMEFEKQKQAERERQQVLELEKRRLREKMEREQAEKMRMIAKQQEEERQRLKEKQKKEEQERAAALRPKVLDVDSLQRIDPFTKASAPSARWKEPSPRAEEPYKPSILDIDSFTSQAQASPSKDLFPVSDIQGVDAGFGARLQPERDVSWKMPTQPSGGVTVSAWTTSPQDPWEIMPVEMSVDTPMAEPTNSSSKMSPEHLLLRLQDERIQAPQKTWSAVPNEAFLLGPFAGAETETGGLTGGVSSSSSAEQLWLSREPQPPESKAEVISHRRSHGAQELNRMRSRSVSRRSAPSSSAVEASLSRMRSRSAHREHDRYSWEQQKQNISGEEELKDSDTPVRDSDSQYGTWETGLRTDDSLTPATPSSESNLSPSPRKPTPSDSPGDPSSLFDADTVDSLPPSSSAEKELPAFPDAPVALLDTSVLRSRAQLSKKRAPRSRPSRAALQNTVQAEDWLYRDSTEPKSEVKEEDSDSEEPTRGADTPSAVASQPQRVALFPGMDPLALKAQLRKRGESDNQSEGAAPSPPQVSRSPKSPFLPRATRVLPPAGGKENGEEESPQWLKELKSKKRLSQYENES